nr:MAG TPA: hypothetical protein [Caudoviricetes sp.]
MQKFASLLSIGEKLAITEPLLKLLFVVFKSLYN